MYFWEDHNGEFLPYYAFGTFIGFLVAAVTFLGAWIWCIANYGFLFGFGLGWLPAFILAGIFWIITIFLWPLLIMSALATGIFVVTLLLKI